MIEKDKGRDRRHGATQKASDSQNDTEAGRKWRGGLKMAIVRLAVWGLIPAGLATWIIHRGWLLHE